MNRWITGIILIGCCAACAPSMPPTQTAIPIIPTITPIVLPLEATAPTTPAVPATLGATMTASRVVSATATASATMTASFTLTATPSATLTFVPTVTPPPTLTRIPPTAPAAVAVTTAQTTANIGWSCGDFPCLDRVEEWQQRIRVPAGFALSHVGQFPGQINQIAMRSDGALYATVLENGTQSGAVWRLDTDGRLTRRTPTLFAPFGLAFRPDTDELYITSRTTPLAGGSLWRLNTDDTIALLLDDLPCCYSEVGNQPNGLLFGADDRLYIGISSLTDHGEGRNPQTQAWAAVLPYEAAVVRLDLTSSQLETFADGIRSPIDLAQDSSGQFYATDSGLVSGLGDRLLSLNAGISYGFPYYRNRGCEECPPSRGNNFAPPDLVTLPLYTLPRGLVAYTGSQFPRNFQDTLFVALWNAPYQQIAWIDPRDPALTTPDAQQPYVPMPFVTGLLRPSDVVVDPQGALVVSDWLSGHVWRVMYTGLNAASEGFSPPTAAVPSFATNTPAP